MIRRPFWTRMIEQAWREKTVVWLMGVRRAGKTTLCRALPLVEYFDCEIPRVRRLMDDPEAFLGGLSGKRVVLDEIHRLDNPSELLKIAADHFPRVRLLATGSSTLGASARFRDTLAGRKRDVWLTPMTALDARAFGFAALDRRFLHGGLPPFFLAPRLPEREFQEWMDDYWAKDILELFRLERRWSFQRFAELLFAQSGQLFEATRFAGPCEVSRPTITNYLAVLEATHVAHVIRPFSSRRAVEIVAAPKVYAFDTGFVCQHRGWRTLRDTERGALWEHTVLNELHAHLQTRDIRYWRDKRGHEVDFVISRPGGSPVAIECKWTAARFESDGLKAFRKVYPKGENYLVAHDAKRRHRMESGGVALHLVSPRALLDALSSH